MKQIITCFSCKKIVGLYKTYKAHFNGEIEIAPGIRQTIEKDVRICRSCAIEAGYHIKSPKQVKQ